MINKIHYISQGRDAANHLNAIEEVLAAGADWIQLRLKTQPKELILATAIRAQELCETYKAKLIINDYPEIAKSIGCYGVHLGLGDMPIAQARAILAPNQIIGGTANTYQDILQRHKEGVDYIGLGPFRFTTTKHQLSPILGHDGYIEIVKKMKNDGINIPIIAIGGINLTDVKSVMDTGVYGIALSGALTAQKNIDADLAAIKKIVHQTANELC